MVTFYEIQKQILAKSGKDITKINSTDPLLLPLVKDLINAALEQVYQRKMAWMKKAGWVSTKAAYTTGTITVTSGSASVTGAGTTWLLAMQGQKMIISGAAYRIRSIDSETTLTLETEYTGTTTAGLSYGIYYDSIQLVYDFKEIIDIGNDDQDITILEETDEGAFLDDDDTTASVPETAKPIIRDKSLYETSTCYLINASTVVTGPAAWDASLAGHYIQFGNDGKIYRISAAATTSITLETTYTGTANAAQTYKIDPPGLFVMRFYDAPSAAYLIPFSYWQRAVKLYLDNDIAPIPSDNALYAGGLWRYAKIDDAVMRVSRTSVERLKEDWEEELARMAEIKPAGGNSAVKPNEL